MSAESYSLAEVADLLGVSKRTLQKQIRDGAFPGRFLAPSPHGMEMRIPAGDVAQAGGVRDVVAVERQEVDWSDGEVSVVSSVPAPAHRDALSTTDLEILRDGILDIVRDERAEFLAEVRRAIESRDAMQQEQLQEVRAAVEGMAEELKGLREEIRERGFVGSGERWATTLGGEPRELDIDGLLEELGELEAMLGVTES